MTVLNLVVAASADDAHETAAGVPSVTGTTINVSAINTLGGFRFNNVTIASGDTINSAYWRAYINGTAHDDPNFSAGCDDIDDSAAFTTTTNDLSARADTAATATGSGTGVGAGYWPAAPGLAVAGPVQEVINRAGWASGNDLSVIMIGTTGCDVFWRAFDGGTGSYATLDIDYTAGGAPAGQPMMLRSTQVPFTRQWHPRIN